MSTRRIFMSALCISCFIASARHVASGADETNEIDDLLSQSTTQQQQERADRTAAREAARTKLAARSPQRGAPPRSGDMNSMLAWAIENSDHEKLKQAADAARANPAQPSIEERKKAFQAKMGDAPEVMGKLFQTESNKMKEPIAVLVNATAANKTASPSHDEVQNALMQLRDHTENIDKANDVAVMGGLAPIIQLLHGQHAAQAASVVGVMTSNNPKAQKQVTDGGVVPILLQLLKSSEASNDLQGKVMYALGNVVRNNYNATAEAFAGGAAAAVLNLVQSKAARLQKKAVALLGDLASSSSAWRNFLIKELDTAKGQPFLALLKGDDKELHEKALRMLMIVINQSEPREADNLATTISPALGTYVEHAERSQHQEDGWEGPKLARAILKGRTAISDAMREL